MQSQGAQIPEPAVGRTTGAEGEGEGEFERDDTRRVISTEIEIYNSTETPLVDLSESGEIAKYRSVLPLYRLAFPFQEQRADDGRDFSAFNSAARRIHSSEPNIEY